VNCNLEDCCLWNRVHNFNEHSRLQNSGGSKVEEDKAS